MGIIRSIRRRIINVTEDRNATDDVNPAEKRTFGDFRHDFYDSALGRQLGLSTPNSLAYSAFSRSQPNFIGLEAGDGSNGSSAQKVIQNIGANVPAGTPHCDEVVSDIVVTESTSLHPFLPVLCWRDPARTTRDSSTLFPSARMAHQLRKLNDVAAVVLQHRNG